MSETPKVSVIIPCYNNERYLRECLDSVVNQTLREIEIICINDGSTDETLNILNEYSGMDSRVKVINKSNTGYGHSMNIGINAANAEYIGIVESDDYIENDMYQVLYKAAKQNDVDFVKSDFCHFYDDNEYGRRRFVDMPLSKNKTYYNKVLNPADDLSIFTFTKNNVTGIFNKNFLIKNAIRFNETPGASFQDNGFWFLTFSAALRVYFINKTFYRCRRDNPYSSVKEQGKAFVICAEYQYIRDYLKRRPKLEDKLKYIFCKAKYDSYYFNFNRIADDLKLLFLERFKEEYIQALKNGEILEELFSPQEWINLCQIMDNPKQFYTDQKNGVTMLSKRVVSSSNEPYISVIIPVYNAEKYLYTCLNSITKQTLQNIEIICIDDGSTDKSISILLDFANNDSRFILLKQKNQGSGLARNRALERAKGEFVAFMDADDYYPDNTSLKSLYNAAKSNDALICGGSLVKDINGDLVYGNSLQMSDLFTSSRFVQYKDCQIDFGYQRFIFHTKMLLDNEIYFPPYIRYQDPPFFVRAMLTAESFYTIPENIYCYRWGHQQIKWNSRQTNDMIRGIIEVLRISRMYHLSKLHYQSLLRVEERNDVIVKNMSLQNRELLFLLIVLSNEIDYDLIREIKPYFPDQYIIKPLVNLLSFKIETKQYAQNEKLGKKGLHDNHNSLFNYIGRFTWLFRKIPSGIRCCKEHGVKYTLRLLVYKISIKMKKLRKKIKIAGNLQHNKN